MINNSVRHDIIMVWRKPCVADGGVGVRGSWCTHAVSDPLRKRVRYLFYRKTSGAAGIVNASDNDGGVCTVRARFPVRRKRKSPWPTAANRAVRCRCCCVSTAPRVTCKRYTDRRDKIHDVCEMCVCVYSVGRFSSKSPSLTRTRNFANRTFNTLT